jgi:Thoeris protein ThsB, TIR-like domain
MAKNKVFISYDYENDKASKDRLLGWDANNEFDFSSYDQSFGVAVDSPDAAAIKQDLAARIGNSTHFLCIVGKESYRSGWVTWEVQKAVELKKKVVAAKTDSINNSPRALQNAGASWSTMFNYDSIKKAMELGT